MLERKKDDAQSVVSWRGTYPIPGETTRGNTKIHLRFEPREPGRMKMPGPMELRTEREDSPARSDTTCKTPQ
jgi:hypothetical protein